jgi:hypothetical protein
MANKVARNFFLALTLIISFSAIAYGESPPVDTSKSVTTRALETKAVAAKDEALRWQFIESYFVSSKKQYFGDLLVKGGGLTLGATIPAAILMGLTFFQDRKGLQVFGVATGSLIGYKMAPYLANKYYHSGKVFRRFIENWDIGKNYKQKTPEALHPLFSKISLTYKAIEKNETVKLMLENKKTEYFQAITNDVIHYVRSAVKYHLHQPLVS